MKIKIVPNGRTAWTWMALDDTGFVLDYGWCTGKQRAMRKAEKAADRISRIGSREFTYDYNPGGE